MKPTLVIGASLNPERYSNLAIHRLVSYDHPVIAFGPKPDNVSGVEIKTQWDADWKVDTVTMYINPLVQKEFYPKIIALKPKRVIFNPGTENPEFQLLLDQEKITHLEACTLVLLSIGEF